MTSDSTDPLTQNPDTRMFEQKCQGAVDVISGGDRISGEHVAELAALLEARLERGQPQIVLDLQAIALIDSAGLELLAGRAGKMPADGRGAEAGEPRARCVAKC